MNMNKNNVIFLQKVENWTPDSNLKTKAEDVDTFIQCINLLMNLCESSGKILIPLYTYYI